MCGSSSTTVIYMLVLCREATSPARTIQIETGNATIQGKKPQILDEFEKTWSHSAKKVCLVCLERERTLKSSCGWTGDGAARRLRALMALRWVEQTN